MQFIVRAYDGEGKLDKRMEVRPRHLDGMKKLNDHISVQEAFLMMKEK